MSASFRSTVEPVLGTRLTMRVDAVDANVARAAEDAALAEADRLEALLSAYRPHSPYAAWRRGELADPPRELVAVLTVAVQWYERTAGAFNPWLGAVMRRWARAEADQVVPEPTELEDLAASARAPVEVHDGRITVTGDRSIIDVHGVAKGWVVDRMVEHALALDGVDAVVVDLGGDLRHARRAGNSAATIAIEHPFTTADNAPALVTVVVADRAVASSGGGRRGWRIGGEWFGHVLDPTTGWPLARQRGATAVAGSAADADAAASVAAVAGVVLLDRLGVAGLVVDDEGVVTTSEAWRRTVVEAQRAT